MVDRYLSAVIRRNLLPVMKGVSGYLDWQYVEFEENQAIEVLKRWHEVSDLFT